MVHNRGHAMHRAQRWRFRARDGRRRALVAKGKRIVNIDVNQLPLRKSFASSSHPQLSYKSSSRVLGDSVVYAIIRGGAHVKCNLDASISHVARTECNLPQGECQAAEIKLRNVHIVATARHVRIPAKGEPTPPANIGTGVVNRHRPRTWALV